MRALPIPMREKLLVAADLFAEYGLDATKMEDIAAATGVPKATLYYYFEGKAEILGFLFGEILDEVSRVVDDAVQAPGTAAEKLEGVIAAHLGVFERFPMASRALQFDLGRAARIPEIADRTDAAFVEPVRRLLEAGRADGSIRAVGHPRLVATAILGAVTTTGIALTVSPRPSAKRVARELVEFVLIGVQA